MEVAIGWHAGHGSVTGGEKDDRVGDVVAGMMIKVDM